jgi:predicted dehydrogenase
MSALKVALIGTGTAAREHAEGWLLCGAAIVRSVGPEAPNGELRKKLLGAAHQRQLTDSIAKEVDVIDLCTPHHLHFNQILEMRDWPVAILVEKPLLTTHQDLISLGSILSRRHPIVVRTNKRFENHVDRFATFVRHAHDASDVRITWYQHPEYMALRPWYRCRVVSGGGVVLGMGVHYFDVLASLAPDVVVTDATVRCYRCPPNAPDTTSENFARVRLRSSKFNVQLTLSAWKDKSCLPRERITVFSGSKRIVFCRAELRDAEAELRREFTFYRNVIQHGRVHPTKGVMLRAHKLAFQVYEIAT